MLILVSPLLNSIGFLSSSIKFMLKPKISFKQIVLNENGKLPILFICFGSSKLAFNHNDFPFMCSQLFILYKFIIPSIFTSFSLIRAIFMLFSYLQVTNICFVSFFTNDGNKMPIGVGL